MTPMRRYTLREVRSLAQRRTSNLYDTYFTRIVSAWITTGLAPFGVSPNVVSLLNFIVGIGACVLIALGQSAEAVLVGVLLVHLYAVLDSVDGELARLLDKRSLKGMFLEDWSAYCMMTAFPLSIALYLQGRGASSLSVIIAVIYAVLGRNVMPALRRAISQSSAVPSTPSSVARVSQSRVHGWRALAEDHVLHQTNIRLVLTSILLVHLGTGKLTLLLEFILLAYLTALLMREAGILYLALRRDLVMQEMHRLRGEPGQVISAPLHESR